MNIYTRLAPYYQKLFPVSTGLLDLIADYAPKSTVLDIGCGNGRYAALLAEHSYTVTAIDSDPEMIAIAQAHDPLSDYYVLNMQGISTLPQMHTVILCLGNVYAYLPPEERYSFLHKVYHQTEPGGIWIAQFVNWDMLLQKTDHHFPDKVITEEDIIFRRMYTDIHPTNVHFRTELVRGQRVIAQDTQQLYPHLSEDFKALNQDIGFSLIGHFSNFNQAPYQAATSGGSVFVFQRNAIA